MYMTIKNLMEMGIINSNTIIGCRSSDCISIGSGKINSIKIREWLVEEIENFSWYEENIVLLNFKYIEYEYKDYIPYWFQGEKVWFTIKEKNEALKYFEENYLEEIHKQEYENIKSNQSFDLVGDWIGNNYLVTLEHFSKMYREKHLDSDFIVPSWKALPKKFDTLAR